ncbi:leucine-rich repeat domain-containing protein, partial [bacterium]|nr:leucine-rich repeat domain-containing protein [bacterium]
KIVIPSSVKKIGKESFMDCKMLTNVNLYEGLKEIKAYAFANCPNLKNIIVPNSVTEIEDHAFEGIEHIEYHGIANDNGNHWGAKSIN